jgi:3-deoxy-D-arabino-heptulosonate 7-phosphate (DAHP) synthase class II
MTTSSPSPLDNLFTPGLVAAQQPQWPGGVDGAPVKKAVAELKSFPPLVFAGECDDLKAKIAEAAAGRAFGYKVEIAQKHLPQLLQIQFATVLKRFCKWQRYCSITPAFQS